MMLLLGPSGSGKSTSIQINFIEAINNWTKDKPLPIYFNLANNINIKNILTSIDN